MRNSLTWIAVFLALAACADIEGLPPRPGAEATPGFRQGFAHGCDSGYADANRLLYRHRYHKSEARYEAEADYRAGWDAGHARCFQLWDTYPRSEPRAGSPAAAAG